MSTKTEIERRCDAMQANGEGLRAAVAWRFLRGQGDVLSAVTGVPLAAIERFVETGEISERDRKTLEVMST